MKEKSHNLSQKTPTKVTGTISIEAKQEGLEGCCDLPARGITDGQQWQLL